MASIRGFIRLGDPLVVVQTEDLPPNRLAVFGKGGVRIVETSAERDSIPINCRALGLSLIHI